MIKYLKYEFRRTFNFNLIIILMTVILNITINTLIKIENRNMYVDFLQNLLPFIISGSFIAIYIYYTNNLQKDLIGDSGYFTFSLPIKAYKIILSKILINYILLTIITFLKFIIFLSFNFGVFEDFKEIFIYDKEQISILINSILIIIIFPITIMSATYFSLIFSKFILKIHSKFAWTFLFIVIVFSSIYIFAKLIIHFDISPKMILVYVNIFQIISIIFNIFFSGYILDNKLELQ